MEVIEIKNKISKGTSLVDDAFAGTSSQGMQLSIQLGREDLALCALNIGENKFLALETYTFRGVASDEMLKECAKEIFEKSVLIQKGNYKKVSAAIINNRSSLVPQALYDDSQKQTYLGFNHELSTDDEICVDSFKNIDAKNIYSFSKSIKQFLSSKFQNPSFYHFSTSLIDSLLTTYKNHATRKVLVHVQLTHFEVVVLENKNLIFYNTFNHTTAEDFMYYLLFVFEQLKLNPETQEAIIIGEIERNSVIYSLLQKYIRNVKFGERPENFSYSYKLNEVPKHFYYNIFSQPLCV